MSARFLILLVATVSALAGGLGVSCTPPASSDGRSIGDSTGDVLRARAGEWIEKGWLSKPSRDLEEDEVYGMAPLLVHEAPGTGGGPPAIGAISGNPLVVDTTRPTVYYRRSVTSIHGNDHPQWSFVWWYASEAAEPRRQGVRVTLDREGLPMVWEVLGDSTGADPVFISEDLETAAFESFGDVETGRGFAVEQPRADSPGVVVVRAIESGPVAMGPFVYLDGTSYDVRTVIWRCMPSQVDEITGTNEYELLPLDSLESPTAEPWPARDPAAFLRIPRSP
jgi:hypothetical protein